MKKFYILLFISILGIAFGIYEVYEYEKPEQGSGKSLPSFQLPFKKYVAALGVVEPVSKPVVVGTRVSGVIENVYVHEGEDVKKGDPLFSIDTSDIDSKIQMQKARIALAQVKMQKYKDLYQIAKSLWSAKNGLISKKDYKKALDDFLESKSAYMLEKKRLAVLQEKKKLYTITSPIDGTVIKNRLQRGMYMEATSANPAYLVLASNSYYLVARVDELLAYRIQKGADAAAYVRGEYTKKLQLQFDHIRPLIEQKTLFLHTPLERSNAKVLQVVYKVIRSPVPLYTGEIFDVYIEAP